MLTNFQNSFTYVFSSKLATKLCHISHHTLDVSLHYLAKDDITWQLAHRQNVTAAK